MAVTISSKLIPRSCLSFKFFSGSKSYQEFTSTSGDNTTVYISFFHHNDELVCCVAFFYLGEFEQFLWKQEEYNHKYRRQLPHAPYEYASRFLGIPFMNELLKLGLHMNTWFPGYYNLREEYPDASKLAVKHPGGRVTHLILFAHSENGPIRVCKLSLEFILQHQDIHHTFGFKEPIVKVIETYIDNPEKYINANLLNSILRITIH